MLVGLIPGVLFQYLETVEKISKFDEKAVSIGSIAEIKFLLADEHDNLLITRLTMQFIDRSIQLHVNQSNGSVGPVIRRFPPKILRFCIVYLYGFLSSLLEILDKKGSTECNTLLSEWDMIVTHLNAYNTESGQDNLFSNKKDYDEFMSKLKLDYKDRFDIKKSHEVACGNIARDTLFFVANGDQSQLVGRRPHSR